MKLIILSDAHPLKEEHDLINRLFEAGAACLHLRKPGSSAEMLEHLIRQVHPDFLSRIVLHDHYHLAFTFGLRGLHLPEAERIRIPNPTWSAMIKKTKAYGLTLSTSVHDKETLKQIKPPFDYVFFSPVFDSISKPEYKPSVDMDVREIRIKPEIIGLGGVDAWNISKLKQMGYDGAAILGAIWHHPERAIAHFIQIQQACQKNVLMS